MARALDEVLARIECGQLNNLQACCDGLQAIRIIMADAGVVRNGTTDEAELSQLMHRIRAKVCCKPGSQPTPRTRRVYESGYGPLDNIAGAADTPDEVVTRLQSLVYPDNAMPGGGDPSIWKQVRFPFHDALGDDATTAIDTYAKQLKLKGVDPRKGVALLALSGALSDGQWYSVADNAALPLPHSGDQVRNLTDRHATLMVSSWAAPHGGDMSIFHDPSAMTYARSLGMDGPDAMLTDYRGQQQMLLWVIINRRADLLDSFSLGPINQWLGRTRMFLEAGGREQGVDESSLLFEDWPSLERAVTLNEGWDSVLKLVDREPIDGLLDGWTRPVSSEYDYDQGWANQVAIKLNLLDELNRWNRPGSERIALLPTYLKTGVWPNENANTTPGSLVGQVVSIGNMWMGELAVRGYYADAAWKNIARHNLRAQEAGRVAGLIGSAMMSISGTMASVAAPAIGGIAGSLLGKDTCRSLAQMWQQFQAYVVPAWTSVTHSPAAQFLMQTGWVKRWSELFRGLPGSQIIPQLTYGNVVLADRQSFQRAVASWKDKINATYSDDPVYKEKLERFGSLVTKEHVF